MLILGLSGGQCLPQEVSPVLPTWQHDASAVLIEDGRVVAGIEEERLNRIKHTNRAPLYSPRFCFRAHGITVKDLDHVAFYWHDSQLAVSAKVRFLRNAWEPVLREPRAALRDFLATHHGIALSRHRIHFVRHHVAHAVSAFALSGLDRSLVVTVDAQGDQESGLVAIADRREGIRPVASVPIEDSLGYLYQEVIRFLGYRAFDEYKVMGLAPYGDPARYRRAFRRLYSLLPNGVWRLHRDRVMDLYAIVTPRRRDEAITQAHKDIAAALQEAIESVLFHRLEYLRRRTKERSLCLAGGVAHNCTMNGRILASGLFEQVFVQPAAHDPGAALGAALHVYLEHCRTSRHRVSRPARAVDIPRLEHLYWGTDIGSDREIRRTLERWSEFISFERADDICLRTAALIAGGNVIGWAQGRSEFGPRALGNRSIVADPRPAANKDRINAMVKKREAFRPFAPSVLVEDAGDYFVLPPGVTDLPYMIFVVDVRNDKRSLLGAVTHVDGSARVQTVSRETNERYWRLIKAFKDITGVPIVLNTSFNNNAEPIVDSVEDAIVCFLTTTLDYVSVGNWLVRRKRTSLDAYQRLVPQIPAHYRLTHTKSLAMDWTPQETYQLLTSYDTSQKLTISRPLHDLLLHADGRRTIGEICRARRCQTGRVRGMLRELHELWAARAVTLSPPASADRRRPAA